VWCRYARRERIRQQYAAIAADKLYADVPASAAGDQDYGGPISSVSTAYMKTAVRSPPPPLQRPPPLPSATDYTHVWQLPLPQQPHDDVITGGCGVTSSQAGYGVGSIDSRYYVLDHNHAGGSGAIIPAADDVQFTVAQ